MEEKRKFFRLDVSTEVHWTKSPSLSEPPLSSTNSSLNISPLGICLLLYDRLNEGDVLSLEIVLPTGTVVKCRGQVRWIKEFELAGHRRRLVYDVGLELLDPGTHVREALKKFLMDAGA